MRPELKGLTESQKAQLRRMNRPFCDCGQPATELASGTRERICKRCADLETERGQSFDGNGIGETCGHGFDPTLYKSNLPS